MKWLDKALVLCPFEYALCLSEADFKKQLKKMRIPDRVDIPYLGSDIADATTHFFANNTGECCGIVTLGSHRNTPIVQINALLAHEAVHLWQEARKMLGENKPSIEFEAYAIQSFTQNLMYAYATMSKRKRK